MSLKEVREESELEAQGVLKPLVKGLSCDLRQKWRAKVYDIEEEEGRNADLKDLVDLLRRLAATEDSEVEGCQVQSSSKSPGRSRSAIATIAILACQVLVQWITVLPDALFAAFRPEERLKEAIQVRLSFVGLEPGHITRDCQHKQRCQAAGYRCMHASLLHGAAF